MKDKKKFLELNTKLQSLLEEQIDLDLLLNPLIKWEEGDELKTKLDIKYAGREFDISRSWKERVTKNGLLSNDDPNKDHKMELDNEEKRQIFFKLSKRLKELSEIILKVIGELDTDEDYSQAELIFI